MFEEPPQLASLDLPHSSPTSGNCPRKFLAAFGTSPRFQKIKKLWKDPPCYLAGKIHYFDWENHHGFNSKLLTSPEGSHGFLL